VGSKKKIGLIAGNGNFPILLAQSAAKQGVLVYAVAIKEETSKNIEQYVHKVIWLNVGQLKRAILFFVFHRVRDLVMAGKVIKTRIFKKNSIDGALKDVLVHAEDKKDDTLLKGIVDKVERFGFTFMDSTTYLTDHLAPVGCMTNRQPNAREQEDIEFGLVMAKQSAGLDIGQSVVVKEKAVLAIEAIEGTDEAIKRGASLGGQGAVVVKVSKPNQDMRFDVPVIGEQTLDVLKENNIAVLAVEAGKTLLLNKEAVISKANAYGICLVGITA